MNVLYILHETEANGAGIGLLDLVSELNKNGNQKTYVLVPKKRGFMVEELKRLGIEIKVWKYWSSVSDRKSFLYVKRLLNLLSVLFLIRWVKKVNIDIIHTNTIVLDFGGLISKYTQIRHVQHIREFTLSMVKHNLNTIKFLNKYSDKILVISNALYNEYKDRVNPKKLVNVGEGIISSEKEITRFDSSNQIFTMSIIGNVSEYKGQKEIILAFIKLIHKGYNRIKLYIVGTGDETYLNELKDLVFKNNLKRYIYFEGFQNDVDKYLEKTDLVVICSKKEGLCRVIIESAGHKCCIIAPRDTISEEILIENKTGLMYTRGDISELALQVEKIILDEKLRNELAENNFRQVIKNYDLVTFANKIQTIYKEVLLINRETT